MTRLASFSGQEKFMWSSLIDKNPIKSQNTSTFEVLLLTLPGVKTTRKDRLIANQKNHSCHIIQNADLI